MKIIMYHYVRPFNNSKLRYLDLKDFKKQLAFFEKEYGFLEIEEFKYNISNMINSDKVLLTFDDGLKDHYEYVLPELYKRKISGLFFIPSAIIDGNKVLNVHKIHHLLSKIDSNVLLKSIKTKLSDFSFFNVKLDEEIYSYSTHEKNELKIKKLFNYALSYKQSNELSNELLSEFNLDDGLFESLYMNENQISELKSFQQIIGSHSYDHQVLSSLSKKNQELQIKHSLEKLEKYMPLNLKTFCYPFGYKMSYNRNTLKILETLKFDIGFVFDNKENTHFNKLEISRIDCNQF